MAGKVSAGWAVAAVLGLALLGKCVEDGPATSASGAGASTIASEDVASSWRYVQASAANCRDGRSTSAAVERRLERNDFIGVVRSENGWSLIKGSPSCWVRSDLLGGRRAEEPVRTAPHRAFSSSGTSQRTSESTYYANCSAARAAGAAPVYAGEPGYSRRLDRDGDGVGCEN